MNRDTPTPYRIDGYGRLWFKNTFVPDLRNEEITADGVSKLLFLGLDPLKVPKDVMRAVEDLLAG